MDQSFHGTFLNDNLDDFQLQPLQEDISFFKNDDFTSSTTIIDDTEYEVALEEVYIRVDGDDNNESCLEVAPGHDFSISTQEQSIKNVDIDLGSDFSFTNQDKAFDPYHKSEKITISSEDYEKIDTYDINSLINGEPDNANSSFCDALENSCITPNGQSVLSRQKASPTLATETLITAERNSLLLDLGSTEKETTQPNPGNDQSTLSNSTTNKNLDDNVKKDNIQNEQEQPDVVFRKFLKFEPPMSALGPLPEGWISITHYSGIPCYYQKQTKVVTWSRPYTFLADFKHIKKHDVPLLSIPCLNYQKLKKKALSLCPIQSQSQNEIKKKEVNDSNPNKKSDQVVVVDSSCASNPEKNEDKPSVPEVSPQLPKAMLHNSEQKLDLKEFESYLEKRFDFCTREIKRAVNWSEKRKLALQKKREAQEAEEKSTSGGHGKVITVTIPREGSDGRLHKMSFNLSVKPMIGILHEYVQMSMRTKPEYDFTVKEHSLDPFHVELKVGGKTYGRGSGASKKAAKNRAALEAMDNLVPGFREKVEKLSERGSSAQFNDVAVDDPRVYDLCLHTGDFLPYELLSECLKRNQPIVNVHESFEVKPSKGKMIEYTMQCGKHTITGTAKNKKEGKQHAAQRMLQLLHPQVRTWGELARRYGSEVTNKLKRKKTLEQEILELKQRDASERSSNSVESFLRSGSEPGSSRDDARQCDRRRDVLVANPELLDKLRSMMLELGKEKEAQFNSKATKRKMPSDDDEKKNKLLLIDV